MLFRSEYIQIMESMAESILTAKLMGGELKSLTEDDMNGLDRVIKELKWELPGAPGRYHTLSEAFDR